MANYDTALSVVIEQKKQNHAFSSFLYECSQLPECRNLTFEAYLITPIQRIPRYKMLFQDLLKHTPDTHPDYKNLEKSFQVIDEVARYVNQNIKDQENMEKLLVIQNSISGLPETLLVPGRKLLKEGILMKVCRKSNKPRIFFLFSDVLVYGDVLGEKSYKHHLTLPIENVHVTAREDTEALQNCFYIVSSHKSFKVFTESPEQRESWAKAVTNASEARRRNKKTLRVEASHTDADRLSQWRQSYLAPVWIPDSDAGKCMICISDFTMIKRRHHCRYKNGISSSSSSSSVADRMGLFFLTIDIVAGSFVEDAARSAPFPGCQTLPSEFAQNAIRRSPIPPASPQRGLKCLTQKDQVIRIRIQNRRIPLTRSPRPPGYHHPRENRCLRHL